MVSAVSEEQNASLFGIEINYAGQSSNIHLNAVSHFTLQHSAAGSNNTKTQATRLCDYYYYYYLFLDY